MTDAPSLTRLSKFLAVMLRHEPGKFCLSPDAEEYASLQVVPDQTEKFCAARYSRTSSPVYGV